MKIIHKSILIELLQTFLLSAISLNFIIMTDKLISFTRKLASVGASIQDILKIILYLQPQTALLTTPMALMIAVLITYGRLNADNEITVMKSSGMSFGFISVPVFMLGAGCFAIGILISFYISPVSSQRLRQVVSSVISERAPYTVEEGIFNTSFKDVVLFANDKPSFDTAGGIFIYDERKKDQPRTLYAKTGRIASPGGDRISVDLKDGNMQILSGENLTTVSYGRYNLVISLAVQKPEKKLAELTPFELKAEALKGDKNKKTKTLLELHRRLTLPFACLVFMFLGPPLAMKSGKSGRLGGLALALSVFTAYYAAMIYFENLSVSGKLTPMQGSWAPIAALALASSLMFWRAGRK